MEISPRSSSDKTDLYLATSTTISESVRIVVPPLKSIPKFKPIVRNKRIAASIPISDAPKVIEDNLKKSIFVPVGTNFSLIINL